MKKFYYWFSLEKGYFKTDTPFVKREPGLRSASLEEYVEFRIKES